MTFICNHLFVVVSYRLYSVYCTAVVDCLTYVSLLTCFHLHWTVTGKLCCCKLLLMLLINVDFVLTFLFNIWRLSQKFLASYIKKHNITLVTSVFLYIQSNLVISNSDNSNFRLNRGRTLVPAASHYNRRENARDLSNTDISNSPQYRVCSAVPHMSTALFMLKSTRLNLGGYPQVGWWNATLHAIIRQQCQAIEPPLWPALMRSHPSYTDCTEPREKCPRPNNLSFSDCQCCRCHVLWSCSLLMLAVWQCSAGGC